MNWEQIIQENSDVIIGGCFTLFGVLLGWLLNLCQSYFTNKSEEKKHLYQKREELYVALYDFLLRLEKDMRDKKCFKMTKETKDFYNSLEMRTIWASKQVIDCFYSLAEFISWQAEKYKDEYDKVFEQNNKKILEFKEYIRKELRIKD